MFWISLSLVNAGLAEHKNRSRLAWFFLSLLLGPVATLYIVATAAPAVAVPGAAAPGAGSPSAAAPGAPAPGTIVPGTGTGTGTGPAQ
ncbi:hypothetical protein ACI1US_01902 [Leucobacter sp. BZR 635]